MTDRSPSSPPSLFDRCFRDDEGRVVVAQFPNGPLLLWAAATLTRPFLAAGPVAALVDGVGFSAIVWWALLEIGAGVNPFRRLLGLVVLTVVLANRLN